MKTYSLYKSSIILLTVFLAAACGKSAGGEGDHEDHESAHGHAEELELSEEQMQAVGITLGSFSTIETGDGVNARGELQVSPRSVADAAPAVQGVITDILVAEGTRVNAGETVAYVRNPQIPVYVNDYKEATVSLEMARKEYDRQSQLASQGAGVAKNLERARLEMEAARAKVDGCIAVLKAAGVDTGNLDNAGSHTTVAVKSPISGVVTKIFGRIGGMADMTMPVLSVTDNSGVYAVLKIYEKDLDKVKTGFPVELSLTNASAKFEGRVAEIIPAIDSSSRAIDVRVDIAADPGCELISGMAVNGYISGELKEARALPEEAVVQMEGKNFIFVLEEIEEHDGKPMYVFEPVEVACGVSRGGFVEVTPLSHLEDDAEVVVSKAFYIASMASDHGEHNH